jgi:rhodanese-related sulfurtransferase
MVDFLLSNIPLVGLFLASGAMLFWPEIAKLMAGANSIGTLEATRLMNQGMSLVLDVRDTEDFAAGHLPRARHIPLKDLGTRVDEIAKYKAKPVILTCKTGARSASAVRLLKQAGFASVYMLKGGLVAWEQASLPVER